MWVTALHLRVLPGYLFTFGAKLALSTLPSANRHSDRLRLLFRVVT